MKAEEEIERSTGRQLKTVKNKKDATGESEHKKRYI